MYPTKIFLAFLQKNMTLGPHLLQVSYMYNISNKKSLNTASLLQACDDNSQLAGDWTTKCYSTKKIPVFSSSFTTDHFLKISCPCITLLSKPRLRCYFYHKVIYLLKMAHLKIFRGAVSTFMHAMAIYPFFIDFIKTAFKNLSFTKKCCCH